MKKNLLLSLLLFLIAQAVFAQNWPQWRGPNRDGISPEKGLLKAWPATGPNVVWRAPIGEGYSTVVVSGNSLYTMDSNAKGEYVVALDAATGKEKWRVQSDAVYTSDQGNGPRSTPAVDGNIVYSLGARGKLLALNTANGNKVWGTDLQKDFEAEVPQWGISASPLVEGDLLLVEVGGKPGHSIVAFHKKNGSVVWKAHTDSPGYSSPIAITSGGVRQILFFTGTTLVSLSPQGEIYWKFPWRTSWNANIATPIFIAPDKVFISTAYGVGAALLQIAAQGGKSSFQEVWRNKVMENHFNSSVLHNGHIYGFDNAILKCIDPSNGTEKWKQSGFGKGSVLLAEGNLIVLGERGQLVLVEATPAKYVEKGQVEITKGKTWASPSLAGGKLYVRSQKEIVCADLTAK